VILLPFLNADIRELAVLSFLEENTGITLRSLWSIRFAKSIVPYTLAGAALLFWLATGIVYVQSHQQAAVYRLGVLQDEMLSPGLHLTLPYPLDKSEIYDTETVNKITIGYKSTTNQDNLWTEAHGESEYRLLLGSGNELVSINLRIEYRISDLKQYLTYGAQPERILEATAYELVTERTINADLETFLSSNREFFAETLKVQLTERIALRNTGLEVINVIMESIHPPVEVAQVYQAFIGAEIDAEQKILEALGKSAETVAKAEALHQQIINNARVNHADAVASAHSEVAEFMAAVEASADHPDEYVYYKYLRAIQTAYRQSALVIVGNGVDTSRLYFGKFTTTVS
jgi:regulator of protease activity HflC (stomatin/prohibitin superfamily)